MAQIGKYLEKANSVFDRVLDVLAVLAGILLVFATLSVGAGIFSRYFLAYPIAWVTEITEYIILYITFLVAAWVLRQEGHVKMDIVLNLFSARTQHMINIITSISCATACLILSGYGAKVTWDLYVNKTFTYTVLELPKYIIACIIFIGFFLLFIQYLRRTCGYLQAWRGSRNQKQVHEAHGTTIPRGKE